LCCQSETLFEDEQCAQLKFYVFLLIGTRERGEGLLQRGLGQSLTLTLYSVRSFQSRLGTNPKTNRKLHQNTKAADGWVNKYGLGLLV